MKNHQSLQASSLDTLPWSFGQWAIWLGQAHLGEASAAYVGLYQAIGGCWVVSAEEMTGVAPRS